MGTWEAPLGWRNEACLCNIADNGKKQDTQTESHCQSLDHSREERRRSLGKGKTEHCLQPRPRLHAVAQLGLIRLDYYILVRPKLLFGEADMLAAHG
jgi:hypothetical protein